MGLTIKDLDQRSARQEVRVCLILLIGNNGKVNLEAEHKYIDPHIERQEAEEPPLLEEEPPSGFLSKRRRLVSFASAAGRLTYHKTKDYHNDQHDYSKEDSEKNWNA